MTTYTLTGHSFTYAYTGRRGDIRPDRHDHPQQVGDAQLTYTVTDGTPFRYFEGFGGTRVLAQWDDTNNVSLTGVNGTQVDRSDPSMDQNNNQFSTHVYRMSWDDNGVRRSAVVLELNFEPQSGAASYVFALSGAALPQFDTRQQYLDWNDTVTRSDNSPRSGDYGPNVQIDLGRGPNTTTSQDDVMYGNDYARDSRYGGNGNDTIYGLDGNDSLFGETGDDVLFGDGGADSLDGGAGNDTLNGGQGNDNLNANYGDDVLIGGAGDDMLIGGYGEDVISGGDGRDNARGGNGNDTMSGGAGNDTLQGGNGDDSLMGGTGSNALYGQRGDDRLIGGADNDTLNGGGGADFMQGATGNDWFRAGNSNDTLWGGSGRDTMFGNSDNDILLGGSGNDRLNGGGGNDTLNGGTGDDYLKGGADVDTFIFSDDMGSDSILHYETSTDRLRISSDLLDGQTSGDQVVDAFGSVQGRHAVLDFGDGNSITFLWSGTLDGLADDIIIF